MKKHDYPSKKTVNLASGGIVRTPGEVAAMGILYLVLLGGLACLWVIRPLKAMAESETCISQKQEELAACRKDNEDYETIRQEYDQHFSDDLVEVEQELPDRSPVLDLFRSLSWAGLKLKEISIHDRECRIVVAAGSLAELSELTEQLETSPLITETSVSLTMAEELEAVITIQLAGGERDEE